MDVLKNKSYKQYDYKSRYASIPYYFNTEDKKEIYGLGSNVFKDANYITHKIVQGDTLDYLALKYYNNPTYWWIIAYFNNIQDAFINLTDKYKSIKIPSFTGIAFGAER